jgi:hypothetical protein
MSKAKMLAVIAMTALITIVVCGAALALWLGHVWSDFTTVVRESSTRVVEVADPGVSGRLYPLGYDRHLLVLVSRSAEFPEGYFIDLGRRKIGLPDFPRYMRVGRYAIVDSRVYDGVPDLGVLDAAWKMNLGWKEVQIRVSGFAAGESGPGDEELLKEHMPIAYGNEIVLRRVEGPRV